MAGELEFVLFYVGFYLISTIIEVLTLWSLAKLLKFKKQGFRIPITISLISTFLSILLNFGIKTGLPGDQTSVMYYVIVAALQIVSFAVYLLLIKHYYGEDRKKTIGMGLVAAAVSLAAGYLIASVWTYTTTITTYKNI